MNDATAANILAPHRWKAYNSTDAGLLPDGQMQRYIEGIPHQGHDDLIRFAERYVDAANYKANPGITYAYVSGPQVDNETRTGNWRHVRTEIVRVDSQGRVGPDGSKLRLVQTLAEGFLTSLDYAAARLVNTRATPGDTGTNLSKERYITLEWVGVDPDSMAALSSAKAGTDAVADLAHRKVSHNGVDVTVSLEGSWHPLASQADLADDGSATVRWLLADPEYILVGFVDWLGSRQRQRTTYFNMPEALAQGVMDAAKAQAVRATPGNYDAERGLVDITLDAPVDLDGKELLNVVTAEDCDHQEITDFSWYGGDETALPVPISTNIPVGTSYRRDLVEHGDGMYSVVRRRRVRKYRDIPETNAVEDADSLIQAKEWKGVTFQGLTSELNTNVPGKRVRVNVTHQDDCSKDIRRETETPKNQTSASYADRHDESAVEEFESASAAVDPAPSAPAGQVIEIDQKPTGFFGRLKKVKRTRTAKNQTSTSYVDHAAESVTEAYASEDTSEDPPPSAPKGTVVEVDQKPTLFGRFRKVVRTRTAKNQTSTSYVDHAAESVTEAYASEDTSEDPPPSAPKGTVVEVDQKPTLFGLFRKVVRTRTAKNQTSTSYVDHAAESVTEVYASEDTSEDPPPSAPKGTVVEVDQKPTLFGLFRKVVRTRTAKNQTSTSYRVGPYDSETVVRNTQAPVPEANPGTPSVGTRKLVRNLPTIFNLYQTEVETSTKTPTDTGFYVAGTNRNGPVQKRRAEGQTEANAKSIAASSPSTGTWFTVGYVTGPDAFGTYTAEVTATTMETGYTASTPYKSYAFEVNGIKRQYRTKNGKTQFRDVNVLHRYAGNTSESTVKTYLEHSGADDMDGIRINPNGSGEYFQGYAYKIGAVAVDWTDDDTEA